jgi:ATP-dependent exoDNAse (exonuclease V) beta subunit
MENILIVILQHLKICDIGKVECVSKQFKKIVNSLNWVNFKSFITVDNAKYLTLQSFKDKQPLSMVNFHPRDERIKFQEEGHLYFIYNEDGTLLDKPTISVTTLIHHYFPDFDADGIIKMMMKSKNWTNSKYYGMSKGEIKAQWSENGKNAASIGTLMHFNIELFLNGINVIDETPQFNHFLNFWNVFNNKYPQFVPYNTEKLVFFENFGKDNQTLCGSIDFIMEDDTGKIIILDWKCSKEIKTEGRDKGFEPFNCLDNCNFSHYTLQLNIYRHILETKYNKEVTFMMLVVLHPNQTNYICMAVDKIDLTDIWPTL